MAWTYLPEQPDRCQLLAAETKRAGAPIGAEWGVVDDGADPVAFGPFYSGRFLMSGELMAAALLRLYPAGATGASRSSGSASSAGAERPEPLAPPTDFLAAAAARARESGAAVLFLDAPGGFDHRALTAAGATRWFTHAGQAILRRDQLAPALETRARAPERLAHLLPAATAATTATADGEGAISAEKLDQLYMSYCLLTGLLPRFRRPLTWWQRLCDEPGIRIRGIQLPTYGEEDPETPSGPLDTCGYVVYRDHGGVREFLETVVTITDDEDETAIDGLLNDVLDVLVREAFWPADGASSIDRLLWHGSPGDLMWSRISMYGGETREQTQTNYLQVLAPDVVAETLVKRAVLEADDGEFAGEITVVLTDLEGIAYRCKGDRKAGRLTVRIATAEFLACLLHPYRLTSLVAEGGIEFECDNEDVDPMWVIFTSVLDVLHPHWPALEM
ncbi:MAG: hypothetical protein ACREJ2_17105 [Planctomycetota bacterium]